MEIRKIVEYLQSIGSQIFFGHVASQHNAAVCATRGLNKRELSNHFWWTGPPFLLESPDKWRTICNTFEHNEDPSSEPPTADDDKNDLTFEEFIREQQQLLVEQDTPNGDDKVDIFISLQKYYLISAKRIIAWILRYPHILISRVNARKNITSKT
ncbi:hypothetical protein KIN20_036134 [Parelaphostrongylus tenuis]|uniref:Uncharacterized protein n=1 Tax=Parelaphostrongylus tenuis TaxID=148309 RepID=A0AAD5RCJ5_PARTN|nr:hypothetical protein KIN20_036134 [Parelaphostrongylus tenuis]